MKSTEEYLNLSRNLRAFLKKEYGLCGDKCTNLIIEDDGKYHCKNAECPLIQLMAAYYELVKYHASIEENCETTGMDSPTPKK